MTQTDTHPTDTSEELREAVAKDICRVAEQHGGPPWEYLVSQKSEMLVLYREQAEAAMSRARSTTGAVDAALEHDGLRWRALLNSPRLRMQGWAGFDERGRFQPGMDERGFMHFGMEAWSHNEGENGTSLARVILTEYADQRIKQSAAAQSPTPREKP